MAPHHLVVIAQKLSRVVSPTPVPSAILVKASLPKASQLTPIFPSLATPSPCVINRMHGGSGAGLEPPPFLTFIKLSYSRKKDVLRMDPHVVPPLRAGNKSGISHGIRLSSRAQHYSMGWPRVATLCLPSLARSSPSLPLCSIKHTNATQA